MILQSLNHLYERLAAEDEDCPIASYGYSPQKIAFVVVLETDGTLCDIQETARHEGKKKVNPEVLVPGDAKPSGAGINPCFLWDNTAYLLGFKPDDPKPERTRECFEAFRDRHVEAIREIKDDGYAAVCEFLKAWDPDRAKEYEFLGKLTGGFGVFQIRGHPQYVHQSPAVQRYWCQLLAATSADAVVGQCLLSSETQELARLNEPKIKGVAAAQSGGALLVSFNEDAFDSYGKRQGYNAPISKRGAFQYATALNYLLHSQDRRIRVADATTVYWTERYSKLEHSWGSLVQVDEPEDEAAKQELNATLKAIAAGAQPPELGDPQTPFYVLGLSPNAGRVSVRFWWVGSVKEATERLQQHFADLQMVKSQRDPDFLPLWRLIAQTAREAKDIQPLLSAGVLRAVLAGTPYPQAFFAAVLRRVRADREVSYPRAAIFKAYLNRLWRFSHKPKKEITMGLDPDRDDPAYQMGRLFAALEKAQEDALPGLNATIKDRYFSSASATPGAVFPRLIRLSQHHLSKLENPGHRIAHERRIQQICTKLDRFASHLSMEDQGLFAIGYYHQRQDFFKKKDKEAVDDSVSAPAAEA